MEKKPLSPQNLVHLCLSQLNFISQVKLFSHFDWLLLMINWRIELHIRSLTFGFCFLILKQIESCHVAMRLSSNR